MKPSRRKAADADRPHRFAAAPVLAYFPASIVLALRAELEATKQAMRVAAAEQSKHQSKRASALRRPDVTPDAVAERIALFVSEHDTTHGSLKDAAAHFRMSVGAIRARRRTPL